VCQPDSPRKTQVATSSSANITLPCQHAHGPSFLIYEEAYLFSSPAHRLSFSSIHQHPSHNYQKSSHRYIGINYHHHSRDKNHSITILHRFPASTSLAIICTTIVGSCLRSVSPSRLLLLSIYPFLRLLVFELLVHTQGVYKELELLACFVDELFDGARR
jgi:hypothetical protein